MIKQPSAAASRTSIGEFARLMEDGNNGGYANNWLVAVVFVQCSNGLLIRPDSQLYIVPA
jgi:hypothetical protein